MVQAFCQRQLVRRHTPPGECVLAPARYRTSESERLGPHKPQTTNHKPQPPPPPCPSTAKVLRCHQHLVLGHRKTTKNDGVTSTWFLNKARNQAKRRYHHQNDGVTSTRCLDTPVLGQGGRRRRRRRRRNWDHISNGTHLFGGCLIERTPRVVPGISTWLMRGEKQ